MSLAPCRECQKEVSLNAAMCPNCGAPKPADQKWNGWGFDWRSQTTLYGWPLVHISVGKDKNGKLRVAKGWIAIGQFGIGVIFGFGQFILGITAVAQFAAALLFGLGQFATGYIAIGQLAFGYYALCQAGFATHLWSQKFRAPEAVRFFKQLFEYVSFQVPLNTKR